jgi:hypothetical protein
LFLQNSMVLVRIVHSWATYSNFHSMFEYSGMFYSLFLDSNSRQYQIEKNLIFNYNSYLSWSFSFFCMNLSIMAWNLNDKFSLKWQYSYTTCTFISLSLILHQCYLSHPVLSFWNVHSSIYSSTFFIILESCTLHQFSIHPTLTSLSSICYIFIHGKLTNGGIKLWQDNIAKLPHISRFAQLDFDHTLNPNPKP